MRTLGRWSRAPRLSLVTRTLLVLAGAILLLGLFRLSDEIRRSDQHYDVAADESVLPVSTQHKTADLPQPKLEDDFFAGPEGQYIINNDIYFPRLQELSPQEFFDLRDRHIEKINALITNPLPTFTEYNVNQLKGLLKAWDKAGTDGTFRQPKVVLSTYGYVPCAMNRPVCSTTGEVIWLESLLDVFKDNDYFLLWDGYDHLNKAYKSYGEIVTHVWANDFHVIWCINDTISCIESPENPTGIPAWKLFTFTFWGSPRGWQNFGAPKEPWSFNPLGGEWNLVPYRMPDKHFYLQVLVSIPRSLSLKLSHRGYHFTGCEDTPYVPPSKRRDQILVLAKRSEYFHLYNLYSFSFWEIFNNEVLGMDIVIASNKEEGYPLPEGLTYVGPQERHDYDILLASSKAVFGIGRPLLSPTPYASLCRGVPVILPYRGSECVARPNSSNWCGFSIIHQHGPASLLGEPYVWMVDVEADIETIVDVVLAAMDAGEKIEEGYQPYDMTVPALTQRIHDYFSIDWQKYAERRMEKKSWERVRTQEWTYKYLSQHPVEEQKDLMLHMYST
ncbi:hypothetical protein VKT23_000626 [Stygiomarasmius scandens]|uniref:Glycosyltransferase family 18 catalytic domain-containing protein n=1 Tax=Marasmiellus scandens TaxID=2682957 RepID=A0ABR1K4N1_9AGAR